MDAITEHDVFIFTAALGLIIFVARVVGEICRRLDQPILVGELLAGVLLGPTIFGKLFPSMFSTLFPHEGVQAVLLQGISWLCVIFLLLMTGLEIDTAESIKHGKKNVFTAILGFIFSFASVYYLMPFFPYSGPEGVDHIHFNLMVAVALAVVALPVISKILFDMKIIRTNVGLNILTSHIMSDIFGWSVLAIIISMITQGSFSVMIAVKKLAIITVFFTFAMTLGRPLIDKLFDLFDIHKDDTASIISLLFAGALINGAIAHLFGIHVIFGAFLAGVMVGESRYISHHTRKATEDFIFGVFAPIFFVLVGMQLDFSGGIDWVLLTVLFLVSSLFKILGGFIGAILGGIGQRNALVVGIGLNTQGTMGVIVGLVGLEMGIFNQSTFSIIVIISVITSITVGPLLKWATSFVKRPLAQFFDEEHVFLDVDGSSKQEVINNMVKLMRQRKIIEHPKEVADSIKAREHMLSTAIGDGIALPHARMPNLKEPVLCFFRLKKPIDYNAPDKKPVQLLFLELTNANDHGMQLNLISQVARLISSDKNREKLLNCKKEMDIHQIMSFDEKV